MLKDASDFYRVLLQKFPYQPTSNSKNYTIFADFIFSQDTQSLFLLKGYAGTGKTSAISVLVASLWMTGKKAVLLAPTRAAKVISGYSKRQVLTIHKKIYFPKKQKNGSIDFVLQPNKHTNTLFIVDEASMIQDQAKNSTFFEHRSLLDDLISYVYLENNVSRFL